MDEFSSTSQIGLCDLGTRSQWYLSLLLSPALSSYLVSLGKNYWIRKINIPFETVLGFILSLQFIQSYSFVCLFLCPNKEILVVDQLLYLFISLDINIFPDTKAVTIFTQLKRVHTLLWNFDLWLLFFDGFREKHTF